MDRYFPVRRRIVKKRPLTRAEVTQLAQIESARREHTLHASIHLAAEQWLAAGGQGDYLHMVVAESIAADNARKQAANEEHPVDISSASSNESDTELYRMFVGSVFRLGSPASVQGSGLCTLTQCLTRQPSTTTTTTDTICNSRELCSP